MLYIICSLAIWRIAFLVTQEDGPSKIIAKLRKLSRRYTDLLDCLNCSSLWIAIPFSLLFHRWYIYIFTLSAGAILTNSLKDALDNL